MPQLTAVQIASLRTHPHQIGTQYLYVFVPDVPFTAQVNGNVGRVQTIPWKNGVGTWANVYRGMTLWVGSAAGANDKGKIRLRAAADVANLYTAEHEIDLQNDDHLTVRAEYELWHVDHYIDPATGTIYKDWDGNVAIAFPGANQIYQPVPVMGPHSIEFLEGGVATHNYDWTNSWAIAPGAAIVSYAAVFPGGTPPVSGASSGAVTWASQGARWVPMAVMDSNGVTSYASDRLFITLDRDNLPDNCFVDFAPTQRMGSVDQGGFTMGFTVYVDAPESTFPDDALVIWFVDGGTQEDIGGNWPYRAHILFQGYVVKGSTHKEPETGHVSFEAETIHGLLKECPSFANFIETNAAPTVWTQAADLTVQRAAYLHMRWNSTLLEVADVLFEPAATTSIGEHEFPESDLYSQLHGLVDRAMYRVGCDYQGTIYFNEEPQLRANKVGIDTIMTIQHQDWYGEIDFPEPMSPQTAYVIASGNAYAAGVVTPLFSEAPGPIPLQFGKKEKSYSRLICTTQGALNTLSGAALAWANNEYPDTPIKLQGQYKGLDHLYPMEFVGLDIDAADTKREMDLSGELFIPRRSTFTVAYSQDGAPSHGLINVNVEKVVEGVDGQTLTYPTEPGDPPDADDGPGDWVPVAPEDPSGTPGDGNLLYFVDYNNGHVYRTRNARDSTPANVVYEDLGQVDAGGLRHITLDSWDPKNTAMVCGPGGVWKTTDLDSAVPTWVQAYNNPSGEIVHIVSSICQQDLWMISRIYIPSNWYLRVLVSADGGATWPTSTLINNFVSATFDGQGKLEASSHNPQVAWVTWTSNSARYSKTTDQWATIASSGVIGGAGWPVVANPHHRHVSNPTDSLAFWAYTAVTRFCTTDPLTGCTNGAITGSPLWIQCATWSAIHYWVLTNSGGGRFFVSDDAITWTDQGVIGGGTNHFVSGWPYGPKRLYGTQNPGGVANRGPIIISDDWGANWQDQVGNWNALVGGWTGDIRCCVPVWTE